MSLVAALPGSLPASSSVLQWTRTADLPDPVGLKGMYAGVSEGQVILAGGSNFPVPRRKGGSKVLSADVHLRAVTAPLDQPWRTQRGGLPEPMAEGATVTTDHGVVLIGGIGSDGPRAQVFLLRYDPAVDRVTGRSLPALPRPVANAAAAHLDGMIYVAGGDTGEGASSQWLRLDVAAALTADGSDSAGWETLPTWPGPARFGAVLVAMHPAGKPRLVLAGGRIKTGQPVRESDYLAAAAMYAPETREWIALPPMPHPALLAAGLAWDDRRVAIMGGSDGHDLARMAELGERYRIPDRVMICDLMAPEWRLAGSMPTGVVGAAVVPLADGWLVAGGEYSPTLRTPEVYQAIPMRDAKGGAH